ncbi:hypothetical protein [Nocardia aurantiaca]|uniref:DUF732 domain-containing protein n=1 Tax=Nocardia aurantiaca TaxID=2675850 RepID=A0A6I3KYT6_9NOCA|nr:hypothetical protein [Nocardia aurantiaca]MTE12729.1 hypothetical protein [Nocardia aurantiaca]
MSHHRRIRTAVAAGALVLALETGPSMVASATALPTPAALNGPSYPDPGAPSPSYPDPGAPDSSYPDPGASGGGQRKKDEHVEKAEKLGGGVITTMIDTWADTLKCTLNIILPTVKCG